MVTFKVGQRVKRARSGPFGVPVGATGVITASPGATSFPGFPTVDVAWEVLGYERIGIDPRTLEPLTDPGFDAFMKRVVTPAPELQGLPLETP